MKKLSTKAKEIKRRKAAGEDLKGNDATLYGRNPAGGLDKK